MINNDCSVCLTENILPSNKCITECKHHFCKDCLDNWFNKGKLTCPMCRKPLQYYNYNGENIRIISIEKIVNVPVQSGTIRPLTNFRTITITRGMYIGLIFSNLGLIISTGFGIFWFLYNCD
tara:strand:- start:1965 stop:2330 length:366 start_codon:yes stop_codon:yes gene_type:complete